MRCPYICKCIACCSTYGCSIHFQGFDLIAFICCNRKRLVSSFDHFHFSTWRNASVCSGCSCNRMLNDRFWNIDRVGKCLYLTVLHTILYRNGFQGCCYTLTFHSSDSNRACISCSGRSPRLCTIRCIINGCSFCRRF